MQTWLILATQSVVVVGGVLALSVWLRRRLDTRWSTWGWGALSFVGSQAVRLPLLIGVTIAAQSSFPDADPELVFWINLAVLCLTSGLFEESARYVVLRWVARKARSWNEAVMFGAGHGGSEAIIVVVLGAINVAVLLVMGDALLAQMEAAAPEQAAALRAQIDTVRTLPWLNAVLTIWERVMAVALHIALSTLVMRAVREGRWLPWAVAVLWHAGFNAIALIALRYGGAVAAEGALTVASVLTAYVLWRGYRGSRQPQYAGDLPIV